MDIQEDWTRLQRDAHAYDMTGSYITTMRKTWGINITEIGEHYVKVFSPDLNMNVCIKIIDL